MSQQAINLDTVVRGIYTYSWHPALRLLAKLEQKERFEDCAVIKQALYGLLVGREFEMTTKTDNVSLLECFEKAINHSYNKELLADNMPKFVKDFEKMVLK